LNPLNKRKVNKRGPEQPLAQCFSKIILQKPSKVFTKEAYKKMQKPRPKLEGVFVRKDCELPAAEAAGVLYNFN